MKRRRGRDPLSFGPSVRMGRASNGATVGTNSVGVVVDGVTSRVEGEPPRAVSNGWGERPGRR